MTVFMTSRLLYCHLSAICKPRSPVVAYRCCTKLAVASTSLRKDLSADEEIPDHPSLDLRDCDILMKPDCDLIAHPHSFHCQQQPLKCQSETCHRTTVVVASSSPSSTSVLETSSVLPRYGPCVAGDSPEGMVDLRSRECTVSQTSSPVAISTANDLRDHLQIAAGLAKARLTCLVVSTAVVGAMLAGSTTLVTPAFRLHPMLTSLSLALGTGLTSAAANAVNQVLEIPHDSQMMRTRGRVLVRGLTTPGRAGVFALGCLGTGMLVLYLGTNNLVTSMAAGNFLLYTTVYTPLKQIDQANTWIGALVGAVPPLMGWAAATGELQSGALFLACLLYSWQFPHFMALSWSFRSEYSRAGYVMTSILEPDLCRRVALKYAVASGLVCLAGAGCSAISLGPWAGCALGLSCLPPNVGLVYYAWQFTRCSSDSSSLAARRLFRASLLHLPVVMIVALIGTYYCVTA